MVLCRFGADVTTQNKRGHTLLHHLLETRYLVLEPGSISKVTNWLLDAGLSVDTCSASGETPLLIAASRHGPEVVRLLAIRGANLNARNHKGQTALFKGIDHYGEVDKKTRDGPDIDRTRRIIQPIKRG